MLQQGNVSTSTSSTILLQWLSPAFVGGMMRFQGYSREPITWQGDVYAYRDVVLPTAIGRSAELTNRAAYLVMRNTSLRNDSSFPLAELMRAYDGMTGSTLRALEIENHTDTIIRPTFYQVRASGIAGNTEDRSSDRYSGNLIFELQCAGMDTNWPMIPALSHTYQLR